MLTKLVLTVLLLCTAIAASSKSYLIISDSENHKEYILKKGCRIEYQKAGESVRYKGRIKSISGDVLQIGNEKVKLNELSLIRYNTITHGRWHRTAAVCLLGVAVGLRPTFNSARDAALGFRAAPILGIGGMILALRHFEVFKPSDKTQFKTIQSARRIKS